MTNIKYNIDHIVDVLLCGDMILTGGNGGSFSDAEHFVAELTGRYAGIVTPFPAMNMGSNAAELTAFANDFGYENIFIPFIDAFKKLYPSFLFITTSGKSKNILNAIEHICNTYEYKNIVVLTGEKIGIEACYDNVYIVRVPSDNTQVIQEAHIVILHQIAKQIKMRNI